MTATAHQYQYREGDEERVAAAIAADPGISTAGLSEELGLPPDAIKQLTATLRTQRRAAFRSLMDEDGDLVVGWYPVPYDRSKAASAPAPEAPQETKNEAVKPDKEKRTKCQYCGAEKETNSKRVGHERFCKMNPNRELAPGERKKAQVGSTRSADDVRRPGECEQGEECVCNCTTKLEQPQDEPTPLARICALAAEMEALAVRHGYTALVNIDAYDEWPKLRLSIRPKGAVE